MVLSQFPFEAIWGMISLHDLRDIMRERDDGAQFQGVHFPKEVMLMGVRWYVGVCFF